MKLQVETSVRDMKSIRPPKVTTLWAGCYTFALPGDMVCNQDNRVPYVLVYVHVVFIVQVLQHCFDSCDTH